MFQAGFHEGQHEIRARWNTKGVVGTGKPAVPPLDKQALTCNNLCNSQGKGKVIQPRVMTLVVESAEYHNT